MHPSATSVALVALLGIAVALRSVLVVPIAIVVVFRAGSALADQRYRGAR